MALNATPNQPPLALPDSAMVAVVALSATCTSTPMVVVAAPATTTSLPPPPPLLLLPALTPQGASPAVAELKNKCHSAVEPLPPPEAAARLAKQPRGFVASLTGVTEAATPTTPAAAAHSSALVMCELA